MFTSSFLGCAHMWGHYYKLHFFLNYYFSVFDSFTVHASSLQTQHILLPLSSQSGYCKQPHKQHKSNALIKSCPMSRFLYKNQTFFSHQSVKNKKNLFHFAILGEFYFILHESPRLNTAVNHKVDERRLGGPF